MLDAGYLAALHESRTFSCPDCVDAMAEAYGVSAAVHQLRVRPTNFGYSLLCMQCAAECKCRNHVRPMVSVST